MQHARNVFLLDVEHESFEIDDLASEIVAPRQFCGVIGRNEKIVVVQDEQRRARMPHSFIECSRSIVRLGIRSDRLMNVDDPIGKAAADERSFRLFDDDAFDADAALCGDAVERLEEMRKARFAAMPDDERNARFSRLHRPLGEQNRPFCRCAAKQPPPCCRINVRDVQLAREHPFASRAAAARIDRERFAPIAICHPGAAPRHRAHIARPVVDDRPRLLPQSIPRHRARVADVPVS